MTQSKFKEGLTFKNLVNIMMELIINFAIEDRGNTEAGYDYAVRMTTNYWIIALPQVTLTNHQVQRLVKRHWDKHFSH